MTDRVLNAIRSQPWAIRPDYLDGIEAIAMRALNDPAIMQIEIDGHEERMAEAIAEMGSPMPGVRGAAYRDGVASLPLFGPIFPRANTMTEMSGATSLATLAQSFRKLEADAAVSRILLVSDSPGGVITDVRAFAQMIGSAQKPVSVFVTGLCCSAAYHICSQADEIVADPFALVGSLGVVMSGAVQEEPDADGNRLVHVTSTNAPDKRLDLSTEEGQEKVREMIDGIEEVFIKDVAAGRNVSVSTVKQTFGRGGTMSARQAKAAGMIDRVEPGGLTAMFSRYGKPRRSTTPRRTAAANQLEVAKIKAASHLKGS